ncbi:MAG: hypothetical protein ACRDA3_06120 [Peptostreptococcaceae bacterium]
MRIEIFTTLNSCELDYFNSSYSALTSVIADDIDKELFDKNSSRWEAYDENNLYGITDVITSIHNITNNQELKNDINIINKLCLYRVKNRAVVALIDTRRIMRDINLKFLILKMEMK